jgi:integrase
MARRPDPRTPAVQYKGVTIRLYRHRGGWKSTYQLLHGHSRRECYGPTQAAAQKAAEGAIFRELDPLAFAEGKDEVTARALLKDRGVSLTEAARTWLTKEEKPAKTGTVKELRSQWLGFLANDGYHDRRSLEDRTLHFEKAFGDRQISSITSDEVFLWLLSLKKEAFSPRTIRNIYDASKRFFAFARSAGYLNSASLTVLQQIKRPRAGAGKKEIYTPEVEQLLLDTAWAIASPGAVPLAITSFSAIRTEEIYTEDPKKPRESRLCWEDFRWKENSIYVRKETDKNMEGRLVPIQKNLREMLYPLRRTGPVYAEVRLDLEYAKIAAKAGVLWKANAHRHSAITYDMLLSNNPAEVANRSGNSLAVIESNYRNRGATKSQAKAWFKLIPAARWGSAAK